MRGETGTQSERETDRETHRDREKIWLQPKARFYHSRVAAGIPLKPSARSGSDFEGHQNPAGQNLGQRAETSGLNSLHAVSQFWGEGQGDLSVPSKGEKIQSLHSMKMNIRIESYSENEHGAHDTRSILSYTLLSPLIVKSFAFCKIQLLGLQTARWGWALAMQSCRPEFGSPAPM